MMRGDCGARKWVNDGRPGLPALSRGGGINRAVIAACHSGSEIDSQGSVYCVGNKLWRLSGDKNSHL